MSRPYNFSWFVEGKLAAMAYPMDDDFPFLVASGLESIVNITQNPAYYADTAGACGITVHNISIEDFTAPSYDQILKFLDIVDTAEKPVGVHCAQGKGRTGTMLACYLVAKEGYKAKDAITETRRRRKHSIETRGQERAVYQFEQVYNRQQEDSSQKQPAGNQE